MNYKLCYLIICTAFVTVLKANNENMVEKLRSELFKNRKYDRMAIPLNNLSESLNVSMDFTLVSIRDLDVKNQVLITEGWITFQWHDKHLMWMPRDYGNIDVLQVPSSEVFLPDITLYNAVDYPSLRENMLKTNVIIYPNGLVLWVPPGTFKSACHLDLKSWPFDEHTCFLKFGSWTYNGYVMDVRPTKKNIELDNYWKNPEWEITYTNVTRAEKFYPCCKEPYPSVSFYLKIHHKISLYQYTIFVPAIVAIVLSLISFWFPLRSTIRFVLNGFSLVLLTMLLLYLANKLGFGSFGTPYSIRYLSLTTLLIGFSLIWSTIGYNLSLLRCRMPVIAAKIATPLIHVLYTHSEHETVRLTQADASLQSGKKISEPNFEDLVTVIDKVVFVIFTVAIFLVHI